MTERLNQERDFDVLGDILDTLRFRGSIFFRSDLAAPWGMSLPRVGIPRFHIALSGECFVGAEDSESIKVGESEIVMLPNGDSHWIADSPGRNLVPSERAGKACELGDPLFQQGKITNRLMCGMVHFDEGAAHPILDALPEMMHFPMLEPSGSIWSVVSLIDAEVYSRQDTNSRIADRLTEVLFLQLLNHYVSRSDETMGFLAALRDRRVYRALTLIHKAPEFDWSLSSLGAQVGMSRATLVRRFQDVVGIAPMAYIMGWRLMKAHELIKHTTQPLEQIAQVTGFASARTLGRSFKRHYGCTPHELRRSTHAA
ncbi:MAG: AraC family transcriptional regulator [Sedimenticolaceae bacterium]